MLRLLILSVLAVGSVLALGKIQSIAIDGTLKCGKHPATEVLVKVVDVDTGWLHTKL